MKMGGNLKIYFHHNIATKTATKSRNSAQHSKRPESCLRVVLFIKLRIVNAQTPLRC